MENKDVSPIQEECEKARSEITQWFYKARTFWVTRRAIIQGEPLWDYDSEKLAEAEFVGPWRFNAIQSAIAGGIAVASTKFLDLILPKEIVSSLIPTSLIPTSIFSKDPAFEELLATTSGWVMLLAGPFVFTALVFMMGMGAIKKEHSTPEYRARSRAAYLYLDGAHGFWPQLLLSPIAVCLTLALLTSPVSFVVFGAASIILSFWQSYHCIQNSKATL